MLGVKPFFFFFPFLLAGISLAQECSENDGWQPYEGERDRVPAIEC